MRKLIPLLLALSLFLSGCGHEPAAPSYAFDDLSIQIPEDYINLSDEDFAADLAFVFGKDPIALNGLREEKTLFEAYGLELDLQRYADLIRMSNNVSAEVTQRDGIWTFSYESGGFTYVVTLWETEDAFWTVQAYCPNENYGKVKDDIWEILSSVTV